MRYVLPIMAFVLVPQIAASFETRDRRIYLSDYAAFYQELAEPPLPQTLHDGGRAFRFMYYEGWLMPNSVVTVRIETFDDGRPSSLTALKAIIPDRKGRMTHVTTAHRKLDANEVARFRTAFRATDICSAPLHDPTLGFDGYTWLFEYANESRYCAAERWAPATNSNWDNLGRLVQVLAFGRSEPPW